MVSCLPKSSGTWLRLFPRGFHRIVPCEETVVVPREVLEGPDPRVQDLKDRLEQELQQQGEEQYRSVLKRKEQHVTEVRDTAAAATNSTSSAQPRASH